MDLQQKEKIKALTELIFAGALWGFGFVGTVWTLRFLSPAAIIFYRFAIAFVMSCGFLLSIRLPFAVWKTEMKLALIPGVFLWLTLIFQTWGLQQTTATNSTFITTLYVVIVPLLRAFTGSEKLHWWHWFCVLLALVGTSFIVQVQNVSVLNWGDLLTLICAVFAAMHILVIDQKANRTQNDVAFNAFQSFWVGLFALILFPLTPNWSFENFDSKGWIGMIALGFGSSLIAFYLQIRSQKKISPSVASLLFLLESPFSCFFAYTLLNEKLSAWQWAGAGMILLACGLISVHNTQPEHSV